MSFQPILNDRTFAAQLVDAGAPVDPVRPVIPVSTAAAPSAEQLSSQQLAQAVAQAEAQVRAEVAGQVQATQAATAQAQAMAQALDAARAQLAEQSRAAVGELVQRTLCRLVGEIPMLREAALVEALNEAAGRLVGEQEVVLRVAPDQTALAQTLIADRNGWAVREDERVRGGVMVEIAQGSLDATLDAALNGVRAAIVAWQEEAR
ncbi:MAG: FliH/SctL family protein [Myxococcota bacterium]